MRASDCGDVCRSIAKLANLAVYKRRERTERDENVISLVLHVFRNLAYIKDRPTSSYHSADSIEESSLQVREFSSL